MNHPRARLPSEAQQACEGTEQGITLDELQAALKLSARGRKPGSDGLPYEFFSHFWEVLGPELLAVLKDAFQAQHGLCLPTSMTQGVITLLYKGKCSKALLDSYRLINSDYKLLAKALATRFGSACGGPHSDRFCAWSVDWRQCVVPIQRRYSQAANRSAWLHVFLDISKAYDRLSRPWVLGCMSYSIMMPGQSQVLQSLSVDSLSFLM